MFYFKDPQNKVHAMEVQGFEYLLPPGSVAISEAEADELRNPQTDEVKLEQKKFLLTEARQSRETVLARLNGHLLKASRTQSKAMGDYATAAAVDPQSPAVVAALAIASAASVQAGAIEACIESLVNMFDDPRIVAAVNGDVKAVAFVVWNEIIHALLIAAPEVVVAFKKLDEL